MDKDASQRNNLLGKLYEEYNGISGRSILRLKKWNQMKLYQWRNWNS